MTVPLAQQILGLGEAKTCAARRHDHLGQGQALRTLNEELIGGVAVIGAIREKPVNAATNLIEKIGQHGHIADILVRQIGGYNVAVGRINPKMQLPPGPARLSRPFIAKTLLAGARQTRWDGSVNQDGTGCDAGLVT